MIWLCRLKAIGRVDGREQLGDDRADESAGTSVMCMCGIKTQKLFESMRFYDKYSLFYLLLMIFVRIAGYSLAERKGDVHQVHSRLRFFCWCWNGSSSDSL